jgi:hypothetical protein
MQRKNNKAVIDLEADGHEANPQIPQRGLSRSQVMLWLQRSRMFIENGCELDPRSSGAQYFPV